jgi:hypothetical protein
MTGGLLFYDAVVPIVHRTTLRNKNIRSLDGVAMITLLTIYHAIQNTDTRIYCNQVIIIGSSKPLEMLLISISIVEKLKVV